MKNLSRFLSAIALSAILGFGGTLLAKPKLEKIAPKDPEFKTIAPLTKDMKLKFIAQNGLKVVEQDLQEPIKVSVFEMGKGNEYGLNFKNAFQVSTFLKHAILRTEGSGGVAGSAEIWFKVKPNQTYMVDCAVHGASYYYTRVGGYAVGQQTAVNDRIYTIVPPVNFSATQMISITARGTNNMWSFQECEITQIGH